MKKIGLLSKKYQLRHILIVISNKNEYLEKVAFYNIFKLTR